MFCHQEYYYCNSYSKDNNKNEYVDTEDVEDEMNRSNNNPFISWSEYVESI